MWPAELDEWFEIKKIIEIFRLEIFRKRCYSLWVFHTAVLPRGKEWVRWSPRVTGSPTAGSRVPEVRLPFRGVTTTMTFNSRRMSNVWVKKKRRSIVFKHNFYWTVATSFLRIRFHKFLHFWSMYLNWFRSVDVIYSESCLL